MTRRVKLMVRDGQRFRVRAKVERFGSKRTFRGSLVETILLVDLADTATGDLLTDHLWMTAGKWSSGLSAGDRVTFDARVASYTKGYRGRRDDVHVPIEEDWKLSRPTKVINEGKAA